MVDANDLLRERRWGGGGSLAEVNGTFLVNLLTLKSAISQKPCQKVAIMAIIKFSSLDNAFLAIFLSQ